MSSTHTHTRPHVMTVQLSLVAFQLRWQHAILSKLNNKPNPSSLAWVGEGGGEGRKWAAYNARH